MSGIGPRTAVLGSSLLVAAACGALIVSTAIVSTAAGASTTPACGNAAISVSHSATDSATGHSRVVLLFKNVSLARCVLHGYPALAALGNSGQVLAKATHTLSGFMGGAHTIPVVDIAPGHFASATAEWLNFNPATSGACTFSTSAAITPANTTKTVHAAVSVSICKLQVHPTVAGTTGNDGYAGAKQAWVEGASAVSSQQGTFWATAAHDLNADGATYAAEVTELQQLIALPDANQTPAQNAEYHHDIDALNNFFDTPNLYS